MTASRLSIPTIAHFCCPVIHLQHCFRRNGTRSQEGCLPQLQQFLIAKYDEKTLQGSLRACMVRETSGGQIMAVVVTKGKPSERSKRI